MTNPTKTQLPDLNILLALVREARDAGAPYCARCQPLAYAVETLAVDYQRLRDAINASADDCNEECDSYGHRDGCKTYDMAAILAQTQGRVEALTEDLRVAREELGLERERCDMFAQQQTVLMEKYGGRDGETYDEFVARLRA